MPTAEMKAMGLPILPPTSIVSELRGEIKVYWASYTDADGVVRDKGALRTIAALVMACRMVGAWPRNNPALPEGGANQD